MSLQTWQKALRRQAAARGLFTVSEISGRWSPGQYTVGSAQSRRSYRVAYHGDSNEWNYCDCMDFRTNNLGTCKHLEAVNIWLTRKGKQPESTSAHQSALYMAYVGGRKLRLRLAENAPEALVVAAMRYFDDDLHAVPGLVAELPIFIENARKIDPRFHCYPDALNYILESRDHRRRKELLASMPASEIETVLKTTLYPYQVEGIRFAFNAGKALIADEMGLGKTIQALGAAELMKKRNMVSNVLVLCPTSLKYQWKKEIERFTDSDVTVVEGIHTQRRELYSHNSFYKIVSYHTLANDIKSLGSLNFDFIIMDEVQRLKNWNTQISQAARRVNAEYGVVLSDTPLENKLDELYSVMQFVDQYALGPYYEFVDRHVVSSPTGKITGYRNLNEVGARLKAVMIRRKKADVSLQLPERSDKVLYVPMTREQRVIHDECQAHVAQLVTRWQQHRFLSEKDRKRLLLLLSQMRMVCDSTFILDQKTRNDTKIGEAVQLITSMIENGDEKAVVFSQWERMTRILAEELDHVGIAYEYLHGGVTSSRRRRLTENFETDDSKRVFISTDAGCTGLNLQSASLIINLDLPWNPAILEQRIARIHRIGQRRKILVVNMVSAGTIEERMLSVISFKSNLAAGVFDGGDDSITLDDSKLNKIVESLSHVITEEATEERNFVADPEDTATTVSESAPDPATLLKAGVDFLCGMARTLQSPEAKERLIDTLIHTDTASGKSELRIPLEDKDTVVKVINMLSQFLSR
ncbi:MAG: DEAD/DEAH box helicase [Muribaculaceae bacterium]|nr:DEAD/DEAH box helicase [Muribaculaceae bacterium]